MNIEETQRTIVAEFAALDDVLDQYELLLRYAAELPELPLSLRTNDRVVEGCQSTAWLDLSYRDGAIFIQGDSETLIIRGIINLIIRVLSGQPADAVANADIFFLEDADLMVTFNASRRAGVARILEKIQEYAAAQC